MKNILVPCDFSKVAMEAVKSAIAIASRRNGTVVLLRSIFIDFSSKSASPDGIALTHGRSLFKELQKIAEEAFEDLEKTYNNGTCRVTHLIVPGDIITAIRKVIRSKNIDLVLMGTEGASGVRETLIGSTTEKVIRHSTVPVLAVRRALKVSSIRRILFPTRYSRDENDVVRTVKKIQQYFNASLHTLLVNTPHEFVTDSFAEEKGTRFIRTHRLDNCTAHFCSYLSEEEGIVEFARRNRIDMIVMGTHGRKGIQHFLHGSISEDIANHFELPLLTVRL